MKILHFHWPLIIKCNLIYNTFYKDVSATLLFQMYEIFENNLFQGCTCFPILWVKRERLIKKKHGFL